MLETGETVRFETSLISKSGKLEYFDAISVPSLDHWGQIDGLIGYFRNITERKQAEKELNITLVKYRTLFEAFPLGVTVSDKQGIILETSRVAEKILGVPTEELLKRGIDGPQWQIIRPDGTPMPANEYASVGALKENRLIEYVEMGIVKSPGMITWINVTAAPIPLEEYGVVVVYGDITERKQMEENIARERDNFLKMFAAAPVGLLLLDQETEIIRANRSIAEITQRNAIEIIGKRAGGGLGCVNSLENPRGCGFGRECSKCILRQGIENILAAGQDIHDAEIKLTLLVNGSPQPRWLKVGAEPLELDEKPYVVVAIDDITERKRVEEREREQRALAEALGDSAAALNSTLDFGEVLDRIMDNVGRVVPHDSVDVILLDSSRQTARIVGHRGNRDEPVNLKGFQLPISQARNLREMRATGAPAIITDTHTHDGWVATPASAWIRANLGMPIKIKDEVIGFLALNSAITNAFTQLDAERLQAFVNHAAIAIENAQLYEEVQRLALTDALTGIYNRTFFEAELARMEVGRDFPVSIIVADLDNLKITNDTLGHAAGDELIKNTTQILQEVFRAADVIARIGGDEFAVLLPHTNSMTVQKMLTRVRAKVKEQNDAQPDLPMRLSLGASTAKRGSLMKAVTVADQHMYKRIKPLANLPSKGIGLQRGSVISFFSICCVPTASSLQGF